VEPERPEDGSQLDCAPSLHRPQIFRDLWAVQAQAAELFGYAEQFCCEKKNLKSISFRFILLQIFALKQTRKRLFKSFLARNELAAGLNA